MKRGTFLKGLAVFPFAVTKLSAKTEAEIKDSNTRTVELYTLEEPKYRSFLNGVVVPMEINTIVVTEGNRYREWLKSVSIEFFDDKTFSIPNGIITWTLKNEGKKIREERLKIDSISSVIGEMYPVMTIKLVPFQEVEVMGKIAGSDLVLLSRK